MFLAAACASFVVAGPARATVTYSTQWGSLGTGTGQFQSPGSVATDAQGNVYVADTDNDRIQKFGSDGAFIRTWGGHGTGNGEFNHPHGITVSSSGNVYVADSLNARIQEFTTDGGFVRKWGISGSGDGEFQLPAGLATDTSGNLYVADADMFRVQVFSSDGALIRKWGSLGTAHGQFDGPWGVALDAAGNVYVADRNNGRVEKFTFDGNHLATFDTPHLEQNFGVDIGPTGSVFVAETFGHRIQEFDSTAVFLGTVAAQGAGDGQVSGPKDVATDSSGNLYIADTRNNRIEKFAAPPPPPPPPPPGPPAPVAADTPLVRRGGPDETAPFFGRVTVTPLVFAVDTRGKSERPLAARIRRGTSFRYSLSENATVAFAISRRLPGRKVGRRCRRATTRNRNMRRCNRYTVAGRFAAPSKTGQNSRSFSGSIGFKPLKPGSYRATLVATDSAGNRSKPRRVTFRVVEA